MLRPVELNQHVLQEDLEAEVLDLHMYTSSQLLHGADYTMIIIRNHHNSKGNY